MKQLFFPLILFLPLTSLTMEDLTMEKKTLSLEDLSEEHLVNSFEENEDKYLLTKHDSKGKGEELGATPYSYREDPYTSSAQKESYINPQNSPVYSSSVDDEEEYTYGDQYTSNPSPTDDTSYTSDESLQSHVLPQKENDLIDLKTVFKSLDSKDPADQKKVNKYREDQMRDAQELTRKREALSDDKQRQSAEREAKKRVLKNIDEGLMKTDEKIDANSNEFDKKIFFECICYITDKNRNDEDKKVTPEKGEEIKMLLEHNKTLEKDVKKFIKDNLDTEWFRGWLSWSSWQKTLSSNCLLM